MEFDILDASPGETTRKIFNLSCAEYDCEGMLLNDQGWHQIDYLLCITQAFFNYTT
jgi:hypothetical protein